MRDKDEGATPPVRASRKPPPRCVCGVRAFGLSGRLSGVYRGAWGESMASL